MNTVVTHYVIFDDKPLPFSPARVADRLADLNKSKEATLLRERMIDPDPEMEARFIMVSGRDHLTRADIDRAVEILGGPEV